MKAEELLQSLDHVGEDLLAEAEQNVLVRRRRPWLKGAAAVVLVLALGAGGFLLLRDRLGRQSPMAGSDPPATVTMPDIGPGEELPALTVGDSFTGVFTLTVDRSCLNRRMPQEAMRKEQQPAALKDTFSSGFLLFSYVVNGAVNLSSFAQGYCFV